MTKQSTFRHAGARPLEKSLSVSKLSRRTLLGGTACVTLIAVVIFANLIFELGSGGADDASSQSEGSIRGSSALSAIEATRTEVHGHSTNALDSKPSLGEGVQTGQVDRGNVVSSKDSAAPALALKDAREEVLAVARRSSTLDYGALETALEGKLSPELRTLVARHKAQSLAFERAERSYDATNAEHAAAVQAGKIDLATREALDEKAHELAARVGALQKLNGEISARFQREVEARIASLSP